MPNLKSSFILLFLVAITGCVGTVSESGAPSAISVEPKAAPLNFDGIYTIRAASDTRVEITFPEATGGSGEYIYDVYVGTEPVKSYTQDVLNKDTGMYKLLISGFKALNPAVIRVEARDAIQFAASENNRTMQVDTYQNESCQFDGIATMSNLPGEAGKDSLRVRWIPGKFLSLNNPANPYIYEIVMLKAGRVHPDPAEENISLAKDQFDNTSLSSALGRYVFQVNAVNGVNEYIARGLSADYNYFTRVRCIHRNSINNAFFPELRNELNTLSILHQTLNDDLASLNFNTDDITATLLAGEQGYNSVKVSWNEVQGAFNHFRVYYQKSDITPLANISNACTKSNNYNTPSCIKQNYDATSATITGLQPNTEYKIRVALCLDIFCSDGNSGIGGRIVSNEINIKTTPSLINFQGILSAKLIYEVPQLGAATLTFTRPDFKTGFLDEYVVSVARGVNGQYKVLDTYRTESGDTDISVDPYDVLTATTLTIRGLNIGEPSQYCFKISPKIGDDPIVESSAAACVDVAGNTVASDFRGPNGNEFKGLLSVQFYGDPLLSSGQLTFLWKKPTAGYYDVFNIIVTNDLNANLFSPSGADIPKITTVPLNSSFYESIMEINQQETMSVSFNVDKTKTYRIGMLTSFANPFTGTLPMVTNYCIWTCSPISGELSCSAPSSCESLDVQ